ncbi:tail fiber protein [Shigella sonnei]|nr:tail fiber protein [Shigella sonnei]ELK5680334.1 tail fiber protein [Shigella sonnei]ELP1086456.1 tail fiber protein [Shigella sonnei]ELV9664924.1 tail fiber protein [Shigella sonnei]ELX8944285.1 tail fiber protein [Shigella sonnei]
MWYREGTITFTQGSNTLVGAGTAWNVTANGVLPGMIVVAPDNKLYEIKSVTNDTTLTLVENYTGETQSDIPCRIITTYEGDLTQFSARFTALLSRMSGDAKTVRNWLTAVDEVTLEREDGTNVNVKPLSKIIAEHNKHVEWYENNTNAINSAGDKAKQAAASASAAAKSANLASSKATQASNSALDATASKNAANKSASSAKASETSALEAKNAAAISASTASTKATEATSSANAALVSKEAAKLSEMNAASGAGSASTSANQARESARSAKTSANQASTYASAARASKDEASRKSAEASTSASNASSKSAESAAKAEEAKQSQTSALASAERAEIAATRAERALSAISLHDASLTMKGIVKLSSETSSSSEEFAATPKAVKAAFDLAKSKYTANDATTSQKGLVQLSSDTNNASESLAATTKAVKSVKDLADRKAAINSPAFTGTPTAPTATQGTNNTQIATTAYVREAISGLVGSSPEALDTLNELARALGDDPDFATTMTNKLATKQPLDATLTALAGLTTAANKLPYFTGNDTAGLATITSVGRDILSKASVQAIIQYLGLKENGTSGDKIPLLSTANTWSAKQTFSNGLAGSLNGNSDTATKLKAARKIGGVPFDGSSDINLPGVNSTGTQSTSGNAASATKLATPRSIGGMLFDGTANIDLPGVNKAGNQNTSGNAATATKLATARKINGVSFDGSKNISITPKQLGAAKYVANLATGNTQEWTTAQFVAWLNSQGAFDATQWSTRCSWSYGSNCYIGNASTGCGVIPLAGSVIEVFSTGTSNYTIRITTPSTSGGASGAVLNSEFIYTYNGDNYSPTWRRNYSSQNKPTASEIGALASNGNAVSATKLKTARNIGGVSFDGTANIDLPGVNKAGNQNTSGNAATATKLKTSRTIGGVSFDGSANINLPGVNTSGNQNTSGNAASATKLQTARTINGVSFDGTKNISISAAQIGALPIGGGTITGNLTVNGNGSFNDVQIRSDKRNKRNLVKLDNALDRLEALTGYLYEIQLSDDSWKTSVGLIAQDAQKALSELVTEDTDVISGEKRLCLNYNGIIALLVEGFKTLRHEIKELREK